MASSNHRGLALFCIVMLVVFALWSQQTNAQGEIGGGGLVSGFLKSKANKYLGNDGAGAKSPGNANTQSYEDQKAILGGDWRVVGH